MSHKNAGLPVLNSHDEGLVSRCAQNQQHMTDNINKLMGLVQSQAEQTNARLSEQSEHLKVQAERMGACAAQLEKHDVRMGKAEERERKMDERIDNLCTSVASLSAQFNLFGKIIVAVISIAGVVGTLIQIALAVLPYIK